MSVEPSGSGTMSTKRPRIKVTDPKTWRWRYDPDLCALAYGPKGYGRCLWLGDNTCDSQFLTSMAKTIATCLNKGNVHLEFVNCKPDHRYRTSTSVKLKIAE